MTARLTLIAPNPDVVLRVDGKHIRIRDISAIEPSASRLIALVHLVGGARLEVRLFDVVPIDGPNAVDTLADMISRTTPGASDHIEWVWDTTRKSPTWVRPPEKG